MIQSCMTRIAFILALALAFSLQSMTAQAQAPPTHGTTAPAIASGSPAGSYELSQFETINPYNGGLNFRLNLGQFGGRTGAPQSIVLPIQQHWQHVRLYPSAGCPECFVDAADDIFEDYPHYLGVMVKVKQVARLSSVATCHCIGQICDYANWVESLGRVYVTMADGTEYEMRDQATGGRPFTTFTCNLIEEPSRGNIFVTADGASATFIADSPIRDNLGSYIWEQNGGQIEYSVSGVLKLKDGTTYRVGGGIVGEIIDRNGNKISLITDPTGRPTTVTDPLNRQVSIERWVQDNAPYGFCDRITYKGFDGEPRVIRVSRTNLGNVLRPGYALQTYRQLFPQFGFLDGGESLYDAERLVSAVWLPDGRKYQFFYNPYGELARVVLPTGAAFEYDWDHGLSNLFQGQTKLSDPNGVFVLSVSDGYHIYRRVVERRVYPDGGSGAAYESKTIYSRPETLVDNYPHIVTSGYVDITKSGQLGEFLSHTRHYYLSGDFGTEGYVGSAALSLTNRSPFAYANWREGREYQTELLNEAGQAVKRVWNNWQQGCVVSNFPSFRGDNNHRVVETVTTLVDSGQVSKQSFSYDCYNNVTDVYEYDFGTGAPGPLVRRTYTPFLTTNPNWGNANYATNVNIHIRNLPVQKIVYDASGNVRSQTDYIYDYYGAYPLVDCPGIVQHDGGFHVGYGARGNLTGEILRNPGGSPSEIHHHNQYDIAGNLVKVVDGRGYATDYDFSDRFGSPDDEAQSNDGAPELAGGFSYAFPTKVTNAFGHTAYTQYDYYLGKAVNSEDANKVIGSVAYNDALDRPTQGIQARYVLGVGIPAARRQTKFVYNDSGSPVNGYPARSTTTISDKDVFGESNNGNGLKSVTLYDKLGRTRRIASYEGSTWTIKDARFDTLGRTSQVSNPYRATDPVSASVPPGLWTTTEYDALGRVIKVTTPDGARALTAYSGNQVTVTDQAGKNRRSETDAIGRLVKVTEATDVLNYETTYLYDELDNLRFVNQGGQGRWFSYDSLSRVIRVRNPEQAPNNNLPPHTDPLTGGNGWSTAYFYDENGNLVSKTDALNITTNYAYDALNRNTTINYSNTAVNPDIRRLYDNPNSGSYGKGRYWHDYAGGDWGVDPNIDHPAIDSYDPLGRSLTKRQLFKRNGVVTGYAISQTYDLAGNVKTVTYPSGRTVNYSYDQAGRLSSFSGNLGGGASVTYANTIGYNAAGQMIKERFGTNTSLYRNLHYNNRMQLVDTRLGDSATDEWNWSRGAIAFLYGTTAVNNWDMFASDTDNNGNVRRQLNYVPVSGGSYVISQLDDYYYDALNRIAAVREQQRNVNGQWADSVSQIFGYDQWGNRTLDLSGGSNGDAVWVDDALPAGASVGFDGGDNWTWVNSGPSPYSGTVSHQSNVTAGLHQHYFWGTTQPLQVNPGDRLYAYVYLDPANVPSQVMLQWNDGNWEHRAYWGANIIGWGEDGTASRRYMGQLPAAGGWARLEVDASAIGLEGKAVNGMAFTLYGGRANWDRAGKVGLLYGAVSSPINNRVYTVEAASNRLTSVNGVVINYDAAGNQTNDGSGLRVYDGEHRVVEAYNNMGVMVSRYVYDADGRRMRRIIGGQETWQVYGIEGELLAEYAVGAASNSPQKEYGYRGGQLLVVWDGSETGDRRLQWLVQDHLGSTRMVVDRSGSLAGVRRHDYAPFGEELFAGVAIRSASNGYIGDSVRQKFTGKERDNETGLDFFSMRYYGSIQGRFVSPDPLEPWMLDKMEQLVFYSNPQKLNKYVYVLNNPLRYIDPDGLAEIGLWGSLNEDLKQDLLKRGVNEKIWNGWNHEQRQTALNARALLISLNVWEHVKTLEFSFWMWEKKKYFEMDGKGARTDKSVLFGIDNKGGWRIAITTDVDTKSLLDKNPQLYSQWEGWNHPEGRFTYKQEGDDIVMHFVGIIHPWQKYTQIHTDAGGGKITNPKHAKEVGSGGGSSQDEVSAFLGKNPSTRKLLIGISPSLDKVLGPKP